MTRTLVLILVPALALLATAAVTPMVRRGALRAGRVAAVRADRWHEKETPAIGGVAIFLGFGFAVLVGSLLTPAVGEALRADAAGRLGLGHWEALVLAGTFLFLLGLVDDLLQLRPLTKVGGQILGAGILVLSGIGVWITGVYVIDVLISFVWFVAVTNAMNLLDNMDGLAAGVGAIGAGTLAVLLLLDGDIGVAVLALALSGSLLGFLAHNYPPARIFMGDSGSLFLGIFLAGLALSPAPGLSRSLFAVLAIPVLVLAVPLLDTTYVTLTRLLEGRPISQGGRDHTSHTLVSLGASEERAVWILWMLTLAGGGVGLLLRSTERALAGALGGLLLVGLALLGTYLLSVRMQIGKPDGTGRGEPLRRRLVAFHDRVPLLPVVLDTVLVGLAYYASYLIRWDPSELASELLYFRDTIALVVVAKLLVFVWVDIYESRWRTFGFEDSLRVVQTSLLATVVSAAALLLFERVGLSRGVLLIDFLVCTTLVLGARFSFRLIEGATKQLSSAGRRVLIFGSPEDIQLAVQELRRSGEGGLQPVAAVDPGLRSARGRLRGLRVFGGPDALAAAVRRTDTHTVVVVRRRRDADGDWTLPPTVARHLRDDGSLDIYVLSTGIQRWSQNDGMLSAAASEPDSFEKAPGP